MPATPAPAPMAAVTVIANPLAKKNDKVLLFQSADKTGALRVEPRGLKDDIKASLGTIDAQSVGRPLANPSQLVSMLYKDTVAVYGITGTDDSDLQLMMMSPVRHKIKTSAKPVAGALAGCAQTDGDKGWLYMLITHGGQTKIGEWELTSQGGPTMRRLTCEKLSSSTQLSAVYDSVHQKRWIVFQNTDNEVVLFDVERDKGFPINESNKVMAKSPLSLMIVPDVADATQRRIVAYFISTENKKQVLCFAQTLLDAKDKDKDLSWKAADEKPRAVPGAHELLEYAQIAVYADAVSKRNCVFGLVEKIEDEEAVFNIISHQWSALDE